MIFCSLLEIADVVRSDRVGGIDDKSVKQPLSEQESQVQVRSILSCFLRHNMSASECKDVLKTMKNLFPGSEAVHLLDYGQDMEHNGWMCTTTEGKSLLWAVNCTSR